MKIFLEQTETIEILDRVKRSQVLPETKRRLDNNQVFKQTVSLMRCRCSILKTLQTYLTKFSFIYILLMVKEQFMCQVQKEVYYLS